MIKELRNYIIIWILLVALFNVICFVTPEEVGGLSKYQGGFWPGYGFITATFVIHLIFMTILIKKQKNSIKTSLIVIGFGELLLMALAGGICMAVPVVPAWVAVIVCAIILVFSVVFMIMANIAGANAVEANKEVNNKISSMRSIIDKAQRLQAKAKSDETKVYIKKIYDALRYSDLTSDEVTSIEEDRIAEQISEIEALLEVDAAAELIKNKTDELLQLINIRNQKCMANKRTRI